MPTPAAHFEVPTRESESDVDLFIGLWLHEGRREILGLAMDGNLRDRIYFKRQTRTGRIATAGPVGPGVQSVATSTWRTFAAVRGPSFDISYSCPQATVS